MEQPSLPQKIAVLEEFLIQRLMINRKSDQNLKLMEHLCDQVYNGNTTFNLQNLSARYGFSERYIQKLFKKWIGLTPQKFFAVRRFNKSLDLIRSSTEPLTSIAFECGYYDQAHFIREFKSYTGLTPTEVKML